MKLRAALDIACSHIPNAPKSVIKVDACRGSTATVMAATIGCGCRCGRQNGGATVSSPSGFDFRKPGWKTERRNKTNALVSWALLSVGDHSHCVRPKRLKAAR